MNFVEAEEEPVTRTFNEAKLKDLVERFERMGENPAFKNTPKDDPEFVLLLSHLADESGLPVGEPFMEFILDVVALTMAKLERDRGLTGALNPANVVKEA